MKLDVRSLSATIFLAASLYLLYRGPLLDGMVEASFFIIIAVCLYFSYRLTIARKGEQ